MTKQSSNKKEAILPIKQESVTVNSNLFNQVKLELGIIIVFAILLFIVLLKLNWSQWLQVVILLAYACGGAIWLIWRIRKLKH